MPDYIKTIEKAASLLYPLITEELSAQSAKKYNNDSWTLAVLDEWRNVELPAKLKERQEKGNLHITKDELVLIMDWKLAKGKFRPALPKLIMSNDAENVKEVTKAGFDIFLQLDAKDWTLLALEDYKKTIRASMKKLCELRGVGPATGSLLLSLLKGITTIAPPFFSDESFLYYIQEPLRPGTPIKYNVKEYVEDFIGVLFTIIQETTASMDTLEKGACALKMYHMYRIDKLADVKLPFEVPDDMLEKFSDAAKYMPVPAPKEKAKPKKRAKAEIDDPKKRAKAESSRPAKK